MIVDSRPRTCESCRWFSPLEDDLERKHGECHRFPPQLVEQSCLNGVFPVLEKAEWCGEHDYGVNDPR